VRAIRDYDKKSECQKSIENTYAVAKEIYGYVSNCLREEKEINTNILLHDIMILMDDDDLACPKSSGSWEQLRGVLAKDGLTLLD
jgi:hypothetical protein